MTERPNGGASERERERGSDRGQLSLPAIEAAIGALFLLAVIGGFALDHPDPGRSEARLDVYAADAATVLAGEPPRHGGTTRLDEVSRSADAFERERAALSRRIERVLPANLLFRVRTPRGAVGHARPPGVVTGRASVPTSHGAVVIRVWYA